MGKELLPSTTPSKETDARPAAKVCLFSHHYSYDNKLDTCKVIFSSYKWSILSFFFNTYTLTDRKPIRKAGDTTILKGIY